MGEESPHTFMISSTTDNINSELAQSTGLTKYGVWEVCLKSATVWKSTGIRLAWSIELDMIQQWHVQAGSGAQVQKSAVLEVLEIKPTHKVHVNQFNCRIWHEVNRSSTEFRLVLRDLLTERAVTEKDNIVIHLLYRRKR